SSAIHSACRHLRCTKILRLHPLSASILSSPVPFCCRLPCYSPSETWVWPPAEFQSDGPSSAPFRPRLLSDSGERCALRTAASVVGYSDNSFTRSRGSWLEPQADRATPSPC